MKETRSNNLQKKTNYKKITKGISNSNAPLDDSKKKTMIKYIHTFRQFEIVI